MTILRKLLQGGDGHAARGWHRFGHGDQAVRYTEAWEHENFAEEQARWARSDPEYARICEQVRQARERGGEGSRRADEAKTEWDARVYTQRQADDDAQRAHHALKADQTAGRRPALADLVPAAAEPSPKALPPVGEPALPTPAQTARRPPLRAPSENYPRDAGRPLQPAPIRNRTKNSQAVRH
jgi:hypothetical protein